MESEVHDKAPGDLLPKEAALLSSAASLTQVSQPECLGVDDVLTNGNRTSSRLRIYAPILMRSTLMPMIPNDL